MGTPIVVLVVATTVLSGIAAGASLDVSMPARYRIGVVAYSAYSQASDLGTARIWYPPLGIGTLLLANASAVLAFFQACGMSSCAADLRGRSLVDCPLAHHAHLGAPYTPRQRQVADDEQQLATIFNQFERLQTVRATLHSGCADLCRHLVGTGKQPWLRHCPNVPCLKEKQMMKGFQPGASTPEEDLAPPVLPLAALDRSKLSLGGGKAANLGELIQAGFRVPAGFCITTAAYERVATQAVLASEAVSREDRAESLELATAMRTALCQTPLPREVIEAITSAYQALAGGESVPVAVRSSATAEDLPDASFAGQQETLLNVIGIEALLAAVQQCFASLWTDRATLYRSSLGIDPRTVRLAVVVQRMVEAEVAGVLFTANPLTGKRREAVIDANPGLGEAVVSGATNPDHFVIHTPTGEIVERHLGDKQVVIQAETSGGTRTVKASPSPERFCLSDEQVHTLSALGARVEALFGTPQDIEWALDTTGSLFLLQARPITTLFPLPAGAPETDEELRVYLAFGCQQGTYRPFTPLGTSSLRLLVSGFLALIGHALPDLLSGPSFVTEAASRPFFEVTAALRSPFGRRFLISAMRKAEVHAASSFEQLVTDPRLALRPMLQLAFARALVLLLVRTRLPWYLLQALITPNAATRGVQRFVEHLRHAKEIETDASASVHLVEAERLLLSCLHLAFRVSPVMLAGMQSFTLARRLLGDLASESECQIVLVARRPIPPHR